MGEELREDDAAIQAMLADSILAGEGGAAGAAGGAEMFYPEDGR